MLGSCVSKRLQQSGIPVITTDLEVDIAESEQVRRFAWSKRPQAIINCAAYTAVDAAESDSDTAMRVNGIGPKVLASVACELGAAYLHVSTDYVLDGELAEEHETDSPVGPCNVYGSTKLAGERGVRDVFAQQPKNGAPPWYLVRTSWLFGAGRSSFVDTMWRLMLEKVELQVVNDQYGRPTFAQDLADFLVDRIDARTTIELASGVWHFANSGPTSWFGFAQTIWEEMQRLSLPVAARRVIPVTTDQFPRPAKRPKNSVLSTRQLEANGIFPRHWHEPLREYLELRARELR